MLRFLLFVLLSSLAPRFSAQTLNGDCLWVGFGSGISAANRTVMFHAPINAVYLRHDRWGVNLRAETNVRVGRSQQSRSLNNYTGASLAFCCNLLPYNYRKLLCKAGVSTGNGLYLGSYLGSSVDQSGFLSHENKKFERTTFQAYGVFLGIEWLQSGSSRNFGVETFVNLNSHTYAGIALKFNVGVM